jgi:hypothetical protein
MATEMQSGPDMGKMLQLLKSQRDNEDEDETFRAQQVGAGKYAIVGSKGTVKPISADITGQEDGSELTGEEYLKSIPNNRAMTVKGMAEYRIPVPTPGTKAAERMSTELQDLKQYLQNDRETYNAVVSGTTFNRRKQMAADMASDKPNTIGFAVRSAGKLMGHIDDFAEAAEKMENYDTKAINAARWSAAEQLGGPQAGKLTAFRTAQNTAAGEAARAIKGGVPALAEVQHNLSLASQTMSPDEYQSYFDTQMKIVRDAISPYMNNYNRIMGTNFSDVHDFIREFVPDSGKHLDRLENLSIKGSEKYNQTQKQKKAAAAQQQTTAADQQAAPSPDGQGWVVRNGVRIRLKPGQD